MVHFDTTTRRLLEESRSTVLGFFVATGFAPSSCCADPEEVPSDAWQAAWSRGQTHVMPRSLMPSAGRWGGWTTRPRIEKIISLS